MINEKLYKPILVVPAVPNDNGIRFLCQEQQFDINNDMAKILWNILSLCNGYKTLLEIMEELDYENDVIKEIIIELSELDIINDSREQYRHFHKISSYPARYIRKLNTKEINDYKNSKRKSVMNGKKIYYDINKKSILYNLQENRKSCRNYSSEKQLTLYQLGNICETAYSLTRHATPSGGALFPLKIYCVVTRNQVDFRAGYYEYDAENSNLILYNDEPDLEQLKYCYNDERLAFNSPVQIIVSADLNRQTYKYANRGYRLTLIEVGQVAQNITLSCEEQGLSSCELGGILDLPLSFELGINKEEISPILAIAIGYSSNSSYFKYDKFLEELANDYVGIDKPILSFGVNNFDDSNASFFGGWANYGKNGSRTSGATGMSYYETVCKSIIEAYERYCSGLVKIDYIGNEKNNKYFFKPSEIAPLTDNQRKEQKLIPYKSGDSIEWTKDMSGQYYIPTDFVYYGHNKHNKLFMSDSSGIAAYSNYEEAKKKALIELIERDSIMRTWYGKTSPKHINNNLISVHVKKRIEHWKKQGRDVHILDLGSNYLPVFLTIIVSKEYPCFVSGSASTMDDIEGSIQKSLQEAEYNLLLAIKNPNYDIPKVEDIKTPFAHGHFYHFSENAEKLTWLWSNKDISNEMYNNKYVFNDVSKKIDAIYIDLSESEKSRIKVVRAISRNTIPISFGYKRDYYNHHSIIKYDNDIKDLPHFFA